MERCVHVDRAFAQRAHQVTTAFRRTDRAHHFAATPGQVAEPKHGLTGPEHASVGEADKATRYRKATIASKAQAYGLSLICVDQVQPSTCFRGQCAPGGLGLELLLDQSKQEPRCRFRWLNKL